MAAVTEKTGETFFEATGRKLASTSFLNLFDVVLDTDRSTKFLNIFKSYTLNDDVTTDIVFFDTYETEDIAFWDDISYDLYGTPFLWWVNAMMNNVTNPFEELDGGTNIDVLKQEYIYTVLKDIDRLKDL